MKLKLLLVAILFAGILTAQTYREDFNYGSVADTLCGTGGVTNNWVPHSGIGTNPVMYTPTGLSLTGYASGNVGGAVTLTNGSGTREDINTQIFPVASGNLYFTFLLNVSSSGGTTGDYMVHLSDAAGASIGSNFRARIFVKDGSVSSTFKLGLSKGSSAGSAVFTGADYALNTTHVVTVKYIFKTGTSTDDSVYAWIYAGLPPANEPAPHLAATDMTISDLAYIQSICLRQGSTGTSAVTVDGGRLAFTWVDSALPIKWGTLNANRNGSQVNINWTTTSEINNSHFLVERSFDGKNFSAIGKVKGVGSSNKTNKYSFTDVDNNQTSFYRIKQVDINGTSENSKIISVNGTNLEFGLSPNPFNDIINIENKNNQNLTVELIDISGKSLISSNGSSNIVLNAANLANGIYFIRINNGAQTEVKRIIKN